MQIEPKNTILQIVNTKVGLLIDCESVCSILNESLATEVINNSTLARQLTTVLAQELKSFANEPIPIIEMMQTPVESNGWRFEDAEFVVVRDGLKPLIGRDLFEVLGISINRTFSSDEGSMVNTITSQCPFKTRIANQFPQLISRNGRSKVHVVKPKFPKNFQPKHQKGRKVPIDLQERIKIKIKKLLEEEQIENPNIFSIQYFISPIVITVKRDQTIKIALDSNFLNTAIHKTSTKSLISKQ